MAVMARGAIANRQRNARVNVTGVLIDNLSVMEALDAIEILIARETSAYVITANVDHLVRVRHDEEFSEIYRHATLVLADGMPVVWASRLLGTPLKEKVSGSDLFLHLCSMSASKDYRLFFLGGRPGAARRANDRLKTLHPTIHIAGQYCPPYGFEMNQEENRKIVAMIRQAQPHLLFVGLGAPKQEKWIYQHREECQVPVAIGIGAGLDFAAGIVRRAPLWMQRAGLEWFWRLMMEPRRLWRRYLIDDPKFFWYLALQRWGRLGSVRGAGDRVG